MINWSLFVYIWVFLALILVSIAHYYGRKDTLGLSYHAAPEVPYAHYGENPYREPLIINGSVD